MLTVLMKKNNRLTVSETARLMEASEQFVRQGLINGIFPWVMQSKCQADGLIGFHLSSSQK